MTQNERVKEIRKSKGLTLEKFGERLGLKKNAISQIETGKNTLTEQNIKSICREFNVNETWLRTGEGEMFAELSQEELVAQFVGRALATNDKFIINTFTALAKLSPEELAVIKKFIESLKTE